MLFVWCGYSTNFLFSLIKYDKDGERYIFFPCSSWKLAESCKILLLAVKSSTTGIGSFLKGKKNRCNFFITTITNECRLINKEMDEVVGTHWMQTADHHFCFSASFQSHGHFMF